MSRWRKVLALLLLSALEGIGSPPPSRGQLVCPRPLCVLPVLRGGGAAPPPPAEQGSPGLSRAQDTAASGPACGVSLGNDDADDVLGYIPATYSPSDSAAWCLQRYVLRAAECSRARCMAAGTTSWKAPTQKQQPLRWTAMVSCGPKISSQLQGRWMRT
jgi:hypothetical protein